MFKMATNQLRADVADVVGPAPGPQVGPEVRRALRVFARRETWQTYGGILLRS